MSDIIIETLDAAYPVAGVDNDTQGFRDNFQILKDALRTAKAEIQALEDSAARLDVENNFNGTTLVDSNMKMTTNEYYPAGTAVNGSFNISFLNGHYQSLTLNIGAVSSFTINFQDWPDADRLATSASKITLLLSGVDRPDDPEAAASDPASVLFTSDTGGELKYSPNFPANFTIDDDSNPVWIEFVRIANVVYVNYIGKFSPAA
jgi:hypothetical protein